MVLLPVGIFDFTQDVDDYYFPLITGNYLRLIRIINMLVILFISPVYLLIVEGHIGAPLDMDFIIPEDPYALPIFWQFILLEFAIDGLKLASLNTPESLGTSLSVIGALILGQFSIDSGWFIPPDHISHGGGRIGILYAAQHRIVLRHQIHQSDYAGRKYAVRFLGTWRRPGYRLYHRCRYEDGKRTFLLVPADPIPLGITEKAAVPDF